MFTEPMHGPVAAAIFWIWLGVVGVGVVGYWLLRPWLNRPKKKPPPPLKYAEQLRQRIRKVPSKTGAVPPGGTDAKRKPPSTSK